MIGSHRVLRYAKEYTQNKLYQKQVEGRTKQLRDILMETVTANGESDELGNRWLPAGDMLIKSERRASVNFNSSKAREWLRERGWLDSDEFVVPEETKVIPAHHVVDEDRLAAFIYRKKKSDDDFDLDGIPDEVYDIKETFALKVTEEESIDY